MIYFSPTTNRLYTSKVYSSGKEKNRLIFVKQELALGVLLTAACLSLLLFNIQYWKISVVTPALVPLLVFPVLFVAFSFSGQVDGSVQRKELIKHRLSYVAYLLLLIIIFTAIMLSIGLVRATVLLF